MANFYSKLEFYSKHLLFKKPDKEPYIFEEIEYTMINNIVETKLNTYTLTALMYTPYF